MKQTFTLIVLVVLALHVHSQSSLSVLSFPGSDQPSGTTIYGYFIKAGNGFGFAAIASQSDEKIILRKLDAQKNIVWEKTYSNPSLDYPSIKFIYCKNGGFAIVSQSTSNGTAVLKTDSLGNILWNQSYKNINTSFSVAPAADIVELNDGTIMVVNIINQQNRTFCGLLSINGNTGAKIKWLGFGNNYQTEITSIAATKDSGFVVAGRYSQNEAYFTAIKFNKNETVQWKKYYNTDNPTVSYKREAEMILPTNDGGYIITGYGPEATATVGASNIFILKLDVAGNSEWTAKAGTSTGDNSGKAIVQTSDSGYTVTCQSRNSSAVAMHLNKAGIYVWSKILNPNTFGLQPLNIVPDGSNTLISGVYEGKLFGTSQYSYATFSASIASDGDFCENNAAFKKSTKVATTASTYTLNSKDITSSIVSSSIATVNASNDIIQVGLCASPVIEKVPSNNSFIVSTTVYSVYPNPARDILHINLDTKLINSNVQLSVIDLKGSVLLKTYTISHSVTMNISKLKAGVYILNISDGKNVEKVKFIKQGD